MAIGKALVASLALFAGCGVAVAQSPFSEFPQVYTLSPWGVNMQTGSYMYSKEEFRIGSLPFVRSWRGIPSIAYTNNRDPANFGTWVHNYGWGVYIESGSGSDAYTIVCMDGKTYKFAIVSNGLIPFDIEAQGTQLTSNGQGSYTFRNRDGDIATFGGWLLQTVVRADGTQLTFSYNASKQLRTILSSRGDAIVMDYASSRIAAVCGYNRTLHLVTTSTTCSTFVPETKVNYYYAPRSQVAVLSQVVYSDGRVIDLQYDNYAEPNLLCIEYPNSNTCEVENEYGQSGYGLNAVTKQILPTGEQSTYAYTMAPPPEPNPTPVPSYSTAQLTNPDGTTVGLSYKDGYVDTILDSSGISGYLWDGAEIRQYIMPRQNKIDVIRDARQNPTTYTRIAAPGSNDPDITWTQDFGASGGYPVTGCATRAPKVCNKPLWRKDARNNITDFTYVEASGQIETETSPADTNGIRPVKRYSYVQRTAMIQGGSGYVAAGNPIWLLAEERICRTTATIGNACAGGAGDEVVTSYDYGPSSGPNSLWLRGVAITADGTTLRTCYGYDARGRRISETKPRGTVGATSCPMS